MRLKVSKSTQAVAQRLYNKSRQEHKELVTMKIESRVPTKWRFIDLETGDVWRWDEQKKQFTSVNATFRLTERPWPKSKSSK